VKRICVFCEKDFTEYGGHEHHLIPKFLFEYSSVKGNPDLFKIILCSKHHDEITEVWEKIRIALKKKLRNTGL